MAKIELLRKLIREEVKAVFQEELAGILKEAITANKQTKLQTNETIVPKKPVIPGTLNTAPVRPRVPQFLPDNPLGSLLAETAQSMTAGDMDSLNFDSSNAMGYGGAGLYQPEPEAVSSIDAMIASARPSSNFDMIQINDVPDFTELMGNLKAKGAI